MTRVLLLSGGMDSSAIAYWLRPEALLFVDYGQGARDAERRAAVRVAEVLATPFAELSIDLSSIGESIAKGRALPNQRPGEIWWPYRNQLLATFASAWAFGRGATEVLLGTVAGDGDVHRDGTAWFLATLDTLISGQEGGIHVAAPAIDLTTESLIERSRIPLPALAGTYSCHWASHPCGSCGGCHKREEILGGLLLHRS